MNQALISAADLMARLRDAPESVLVLDASFELSDPAAGARSHAAARLPGSVYVHLDADLSAAKTGLNGRHPLPTPQAFCSRMAALGARDDQTIVAYDANGSMYAARLWWMLRWVGHADVRVLDGGLAAWRVAGGAVAGGAVAGGAVGGGALSGELVSARAAASNAGFSLRPSLVTRIDHAALRANLGTDQTLVVDARAPDRYRGENETLDPVGGRIPGAANRFFRDNLAADGCFKPADQLRAEWLALIGDRAPAALAHQCGSGVTACHNLLAMESAGLPGAALYPGSWSEWCAQPGAPIARG